MATPKFVTKNLIADEVIDKIFEHFDSEASQFDVDNDCLIDKENKNNQ